MIKLLLVCLLSMLVSVPAWGLSVPLLSGSGGATSPASYAFDCTGSDGTDLPVIDSTWVDNATSWQILSNECEPVGSSSTISMVHYESALDDDQYAEATITGIEGLGWAGLLVRGASGATQTGYDCIADSASSLLIRWHNAGSITTLGSNASTYSNGQVMRLEVVDDRIICKMDSVLQLEVTDINVTSGYAGFAAQGGNGAKTVDNWSASVCTQATCGEHYTEDFEGTGTPSGWATGGTVDFDNTTSPLEGSEDALLSPAGIIVYDPNYHSSEHTWTVWLQYDDALESQEDIFYARDGTTVLGTVAGNPSTNLWVCSVSGGSGGSPSGGSFDETALQKIKITYVQGTGSNASITGWEWNGSSWDQFCTQTNGTSTAQIDNIRIQNGADTENLQVDYFKSSTFDISSPD